MAGGSPLLRSPRLKIQNLVLRGTDYPLIKISDQLLWGIIMVGWQNPVVSPPQVLEHRELALTGQKDRLNGNGSGRNNSRQFERDAAWIGDVGDNEPRHMGQGRDCPYKILAGWLVEVEQDWHVAAVAQLVPQRVEDFLSPWREAAED
jgi:hypothetical protein